MVLFQTLSVALNFVYVFKRKTLCKLLRSLFTVTDIEFIPGAGGCQQSCSFTHNWKNEDKNFKLRNNLQLVAY